MVGVLLRLIAAHIFSDFLLQPDRMVRGKSSKYGVAVIALHSLVHAIVSYVLVGRWDCWLLPLLVFLTHSFIDWIKVKCFKGGFIGFVIDQCLHIMALVVIAYALFARGGGLEFLCELWQSQRAWAIVIVLLLIFEPTSIFLGKFLQQWSIDTPDTKGLQRGGKWIGYLERLLIVIFVLANCLEGIGFLLAAKSIFRFGELNKAKDVKTTEYVLIGTFASFTIAIVLAFLIKMIP